MGNFIMVALGSSGDVNPFLGIAADLNRRGHQTALLSAPQFAPAAASAGSDFAPLGTAGAYDAIYEDPNLWHPRRGLRIYFSYLGDRVEETASIIERRYEPGNTVVLASFQCFGARVAQESLGVPLCTVLPYPISIQSVHDPNRNPFGNPPRWLGRGAVRLMYRAINWEVSRHARGGIDAARGVRGLTPPVRDVVGWSYSPDLIVGLWPSVFSRPQPDWPPHATNTGFVRYDGPAAARWSPPADLPDRDDWLVFAPGTQMTHGAQYFRVATDVARRTGLPTLMVAPDRSVLPTALPDNVRHLAFVPFAWLFDRATAVVHHGGIGTAGRALEAGLPQIIVPRGFDQFDNAQRVERIGAGVSLGRRQLTPDALLSVLRGLLADDEVRRRCDRIRDELAGTDANDETCRLVEGLLAA
jgi:rhamnosyltransferase subunit B